MAKYFWGAALFTLPFTLTTVLWQSDIFVQGSFNAYTSFSLYGSEILLFLAFGIWIIESALKGKWKIDKEALKLSGLILGLAIISLIFSQDKTASLLQGIHLFAGIMAFLMASSELLKPKTLIKIFTLSMAIQAIIGILQVATQNSLGLAMIGESLIHPDIAGVAKISLKNITFIRAYGTFPHANILAGFLLMGILFAHKLPKKALWKTTKILLWIGFFLAFSKAAILALLVILFLGKKIPREWGIAGILFIAFLSIQAQESTAERWQYIKISLNTLAAEPIGIGLDQFTARMQEFTALKLQPWQFQPVHNIYLLIANELGWWTLGLLGIGLHKIRKNIAAPLIALLIIGLFDHYLITLYPGLVLLGTTFGLNYPSIALKKLG